MKHFFIDEKTGKLFVIPEMPEEPGCDCITVSKHEYAELGRHCPLHELACPYRRGMIDYKESLQSVKAKAVEVDNQDEVHRAIYPGIWTATGFKLQQEGLDWVLSYRIGNQHYCRNVNLDTIYSLECEVEIKTQFYHVSSKDSLSGWRLCKHNEEIKYRIDRGQRTRQLAFITFPQLEKKQKMKIEEDKPNFRQLANEHYDRVGRNPSKKLDYHEVEAYAKGYQDAWIKLEKKEESTKESQEGIWNDVELIINSGEAKWSRIVSELKSKFVLTRKPQTP